MRRRRTLGVLGSLCNPPHLGHLVLAQEAAWQLDLDGVLLVPTGTPSHRPAPPESAAVRLRLAQAAAEADPLVTASAVEVERLGPSYMADTLEVLARTEEAELVLILGADQYATLDAWHDPDRVRAAARIAVAPRPGGPPLTGDDRCVPIGMPTIDVSSSDIRRRVAAGAPIRHLVSDAVRNLIDVEGLYRDQSADGESADDA